MTGRRESGRDQGVACLGACEALRAGLLLAASAVGMLAGDVIAGRFLSPGLRHRLGPLLRLLLAVPYLLFALRLPAPVAALAVAVASVGYASTLLLQERLLALTPPENRGQALGLHTSGMRTMQAVGAGLAGAVAEYLGPGTAIVVMAVASIAVTLAVGARIQGEAGGRREATRGIDDRGDRRQFRGGAGGRQTVRRAR